MFFGESQSFGRYHKGRELDAKILSNRKINLKWTNLGKFLVKQNQTWFSYPANEVIESARILYLGICSSNNEKISTSGSCSELHKSLKKRKILKLKFRNFQFFFKFIFSEILSRRKWWFICEKFLFLFQGSQEIFIEKICNKIYGKIWGRPQIGICTVFCYKRRGGGV